MGLGGVSPGSLLLIFFIVLILFGTKKLRSIGEDLGHALRGFRKALNSSENDPIQPLENLISNLSQKDQSKPPSNL